MNNPIFIVDTATNEVHAGRRRGGDPICGAKWGWIVTTTYRDDVTCPACVEMQRQP